MQTFQMIDVDGSVLGDGTINDDGTVAYQRTGVQPNGEAWPPEAWLDVESIDHGHGVHRVMAETS